MAPYLPKLEQTCRSYYYISQKLKMCCRHVQLLFLDNNVNPSGLQSSYLHMHDIKVTNKKFPGIEINFASLR